MTVEKLYEDYASIIYYFLLKLTKSNEVANDLTQDVFIVALNKFSDKVEKPKSWLMKIAYNLSLKHFNNSKKEVISSEVSETFTEVEKIDWKIIRSDIEQMLTNEKELYLSVFLLKMDYQLSHREIANILSKPTSSIVRHLDKIRKIIEAKYGNILHK